MTAGKNRTIHPNRRLSATYLCALPKKYLTPQPVLKNKFLQHIASRIDNATAPADALLFFAALLVVSMPLSPFLLSISMWGLVFVAFWRLAADKRQATGGNIQWAKGRVVWDLLVESFRHFFRQPVYAVLVLLLLVPAFSGLWSADQVYWLERTRVRLPFLVLPWAFANLPALTQRQYQLVLYLLVWTMVILCAGVGINFLLHKPEIMHAMYQGRPIPVPRHHIRFSLMLATAVIAGGWLWHKRFFWRYAWEHSALGVATVFMFAFLHFLSVRSGLMALYVALFFTLGYFVWRTRRWRLALGMLALLAVLPWVAINTLPSLKQKMEYMVYDWGRYLENEGETYSDAERWISLKTGWQIWRENPWLGAGAGDLPAETDRIVKKNYPAYEPTPKLPHNQFLYILAGTGLFGLALSLFAFLFPVFAGQHRFHYLFAVFQILVFTSFLVEYTIETSMGVAWYLFYTLWFMQLKKG